MTEEPAVIPIWMALDPETCRVMLHDREFDDGSFPRGPRGLSWPIRRVEIDEDTWAALLAGALSPDEQDDLHRTLWTENGATPWPNP